MNNTHTGKGSSYMRPDRFEYGRLLLHDLWLERRKRILSRDGNRCRCCGKEQGLVVHHRQYHVDSVTGRMVAPWEYEDRHLVTLCKTCHQAGHNQHRIPTFKK
jgi:hypothetical protein